MTSPPKGLGGHVAQWIERQFSTLEVIGSNPIVTTIGLEAGPASASTATGP